MRKNRAKESIVVTRKCCYYCGREDVELHHCWHGTANRRLADQDGLWVYLCPDHHRRLHDKGEHDRELMATAEYAWMIHNHKTEADFRRRYGKSVLSDAHTDEYNSSAVIASINAGDASAPAGGDMGKKSRDKGKRGERELAGILRDYGYDARRGQQYSGLLGDADVIGLPGIHIECKRVERLNIYEAMFQAKRDAAREGADLGEPIMPAVFHRKDHQDWLVTMELDDWISLYREAEL